MYESAAEINNSPGIDQRGVEYGLAPFVIRRPMLCDGLQSVVTEENRSIMHACANPSNLHRFVKIKASYD